MRWVAVGIFASMLVGLAASPCAAEEPTKSGELVAADQLPAVLSDQYTIQSGTCWQ